MADLVPRRILSHLLFLFAVLVGSSLLASPALGQTTIFSENFGSGDLGKFSQFSVASNANWSNSNGAASINGFGADEASNDWLISSSLDLTSTNSEELTATIGNQYGGPDLKVKVSTNYSGTGDPTTATWTEAKSITPPGGTVDITVDLSAYSGNSSVYVAFQYTSTGTGGGDAADFTVDDVTVTSTSKPTIRFTSSTAKAAEDGGSTTLTAEIAGVDPSNEISAEVAFNGGNSSADVSDIGNYTMQTITFPSSATVGDTKDVTVTLSDDGSQEGNETAEFELTNLTTSGNAEIGSPSVITTTIIDDDRSVDDARTALRNGNEEEVVLKGTVTRAYGSYARLQDNSGPTGASAIVIRQTSGGLSSGFQQDITDGNIQPGTELRVQGTLSQFSGLIQLSNSDLSGYSIQGQGTPPTPQDVNLSDIKSNGEDYESELVRITGVEFTSASGNFSSGTNYDVKDGSLSSSFTDAFRVQGSDESALDGASIPSGTFTFTDVVGQFNSFGGVDNDTGYQLIGIRPSTALPVELTAFDAEQAADGVVLSWQTASETNNAGFRVQRKAEDGSWSEIQFVDGNGTTTRTSRYQVRDSDLPYTTGEVTYRLKQVDIDGSTELSDPVTVELGGAQSLALANVYPNPATGPVTVKYTVPAEMSGDVTLQLFDVLGRVVRTVADEPANATGRQKATISTGGLSTGTYFLRLSAGGQTRTEQVTVVQ